MPYGDKPESVNFKNFSRVKRLVPGLRDQATNGKCVTYRINAEGKKEIVRVD